MPGSGLCGVAAAMVFEQQGRTKSRKEEVEEMLNRGLGITAPMHETTYVLAFNACDYARLGVE